METLDKRVAEFVLCRQRNYRVSAASLLSSLKLEDDDVSVKEKKSSVLRDISTGLSQGKVDEEMLDLLETLERLLLEEHSLLLDSHKLAYCWMAAECTRNFMWPLFYSDSLFPDVLERIWTKRVGILKRKESKLVTDELLKWETDLRKAINEPDLYHQILETNVRYTAITYLNQFLREQWALVRCSSLESVAQKLFSEYKTESVGGPNAALKLDNLNESNVVAENIDESEQEEEEEEEEESNFYEADKMVVQELKEALSEIQGIIASSTGKEGPNNENEHAFDDTPRPTPGEGQNHNETLDNAERGLDNCQGISYGIVTPYLSSPARVSVSPLEGNMAKHHLARTKKLWTPEEVEALREGVKEFGKSWKDIKNANPSAFADRTEVDLKDKWRNLSFA